MIRELVQVISGYSGLFAFCAVSGILVPLPEDIPLLYAGIQLGGGEWSWAPTLTAAILGVGVRDLIAYGIGRLLGDWVLGTWGVRLIGQHKLSRARELVSQRGAGAVLFGRFLVGVRAPVFIVCGASGVPVGKFVMYDFLGLLIAVPAVVMLGYAFGDPVVDSALWVLKRTRIAGVLLFLAGAAWLWWRLRSKTPLDSES